jgi:hypothetical protein
VGPMAVKAWAAAVLNGRHLERLSWPAQESGGGSTSVPLTRGSLLENISFPIILNPRERPNNCREYFP